MIAPARARASSQEAIVLLAVALGFVLAACAVAVLLSDALRDEFKVLPLQQGQLRTNIVVVVLLDRERRRLLLRGRLRRRCGECGLQHERLPIFRGRLLAHLDPTAAASRLNDWASTEQICQTLCFTGAC